MNSENCYFVQAPELQKNKVSYLRHSLLRLFRNKATRDEMLSLYGLVTLAIVHVKLPRLTLNLAVRKVVYAHFPRLTIVHRRPNLALTRSLL